MGVILGIGATHYQPGLVRGEEQLRAGDYESWRDLLLAQLEASGQHEVLSWLCLAGAMAELGVKMELVDC